ISVPASPGGEHAAADAGSTADCIWHLDLAEPCLGGTPYLARTATCAALWSLAACGSVFHSAPGRAGAATRSAAALSGVRDGGVVSGAASRSGPPRRTVAGTSGAEATVWSAPGTLRVVEATLVRRARCCAGSWSCARHFGVVCRTWRHSGVCARSL